MAFLYELYVVDFGIGNPDYDPLANYNLGDFPTGVIYPVVYSDVDPGVNYKKEHTIQRWDQKGYGKAVVNFNDPGEIADHSFRKERVKEIYKQDFGGDINNPGLTQTDKMILSCFMIPTPVEVAVIIPDRKARREVVEKNTRENRASRRKRSDLAESEFLIEINSLAGSLIGSKLSRNGLFESYIQFGVVAKAIKGETGIADFCDGSASFSPRGVVGVDTVLKKISIGGDCVAQFRPDRFMGASFNYFRMSESTGNDGLYTVDSATLVAGNTDIIVNEAVADATVYPLSGIFRPYVPTAVNDVAKTFTFVEDVRAIPQDENDPIEVGDTFRVFESDGSNTLFTISAIDPGGNVVTVNEAITDVTLNKLIYLVGFKSSSAWTQAMEDAFTRILVAGVY